MSEKKHAYPAEDARWQAAAVQPCTLCSAGFGWLPPYDRTSAAAVQTPDKASTNKASTNKASTKEHARCAQPQVTPRGMGIPLATLIFEQPDGQPVPHTQGDSSKTHAGSQHPCSRYNADAAHIACASSLLLLPDTPNTLPHRHTRFTPWTAFHRSTPPTRSTSSRGISTHAMREPHARHAVMVTFR